MGTYKYNYNWNFFEEDSEELYYFLGFIAADGYLSENEIEIGLKNEDAYIVEHFRDLIVPEKPIYNRSKTNSCMLKLSCRSRIPYFKNFFGMTTNTKWKEIQFPSIPEAYVKDFIRGYVDGDGNIDTTKGYRDQKVYVGPRLRILGNEEFLKSLNAATKKFVKHNTNAVNKKGKKENIYVITYNFSTAANLLEWLYDESAIHLERKKALAQEVTQRYDNIAIR